MERGESPYHRKMCPAMKDAGIEDPESKEGIIFCTGKCPYDRCIVFEANKSPYTVIRNNRAEKAKIMKAEGHSLKDIAAAIGKNVRTIERYLRL